jgi:KaiC/GvpD/RAD55 family RecA-like ATPase
MGSVKEINQEQNLVQFFDKIFGQQVGYVYAPTKSFDEHQRWTKHFYHWPNEKDRLIEHVISKTITHEAYYCPVLFKRPAHSPESLTPEHVHGSYYVWAEFDYGVPDYKKLAELGIPEPSIRIRSSERQKQHWYWRLDTFQTDYRVLETLSQRLAYALEADLSGWDYQQVLRPPGTIHHESKRTVLLLSKSDTYYSVDNFEDLPEVPSDVFSDLKLGAIPVVNLTVLKYAFPDDTADLFRKRVEELNVKNGAVRADRSDALMRLGYDFAMIGMSNEEIYALLRNADDRWGKFKSNKQSDEDRQYKHLMRIIRRARLKYPITQVDDLAEEFPVFGLVDFLNTTVVIDWMVENLMQSQGLTVVSAPPGVGKTQFCLWFAMSLATNKEVFGWSVNRPVKTMFVSMEMGHADLKYIVEQMSENFTDEEKQLLQENLLLVPLGFSVLMDKVANQDKIAALVKEHKPEGVMFDSLGVAIGDDISSDTVINKTFAFVNKVIRDEHKAFVWFIHHQRKAQANNKQPKKLEDLYGSMYIGAQATTVIGLWPVGNEIEVNCLKLRLATPFKTFRIKRTQPLGFTVSSTSEISDSELAGFTNLMTGIKKSIDNKGEGANGFGL